jgi:carboxylesterase type B
VYTPSNITRTAAAAAATAPLLPVMLWIYGGAFANGNNWEKGGFDGTHLAREHGVVVVAGNYRLGAFGWVAARRFRPRPARTAAPATTVCRISRRRCGGCRPTSRRLAAIRRT